MSCTAVCASTATVADDDAARDRSTSKFQSIETGEGNVAYMVRGMK